MSLFRTGVVALALSCLGAGCRRADSPGGLAAGDIEPLVVREAGLATPESVLHDPLQDFYLVSNIDGSPLGEDDNGFITMLSADGDTLRSRWIDGASEVVTLNAPKGMAVAGFYLYVADINTIRRFDRRSGEPRGDFPVPGATFLNDIAAHEDESIYFTDSGLRAGPDGLEASGTDAVYRMTPDGTLHTLVKGPELGHPNGIAVVGDTVWVVNGNGELYRVAGGSRQAVTKVGHANLDGLVVFQGEAFVSTWDGKAVLRGKLGGPFRPLLPGLDAPADIGHDVWRNRILIPMFRDNEVRIVKLVEF